MSETDDTTGKIIDLMAALKASLAGGSAEKVRAAAVVAPPDSRPITLGEARQIALDGLHRAERIRSEASDTEVAPPDSDRAAETLAERLLSALMEYDEALYSHAHMIANKKRFTRADGWDVIEGLREKHNVHALRAAVVGRERRAAGAEAGCAKACAGQARCVNGWPDGSCGAREQGTQWPSGRRADSEQELFVDGYLNGAAEADEMADKRRRGVA